VDFHNFLVVENGVLRLSDDIALHVDVPENRLNPPIKLLPTPILLTHLGLLVTMKKSRAASSHKNECHRRLVLAVTTVLWMIPSSDAFSVPGTGTGLARLSPLLSTFEKEMKPTEETMGGSGWLDWMTAGGSKPRGSADVYMRDPEELGGVARSARYSSRDWWHNTISLPSSGILRDISFPVISITSWATFVSILYVHLVNTGQAAVAKHMCVSSTAHSLMVSALGLLLVFRTNSAYQRFAVRRTLPLECVSACAWRLTLLSSFDHNCRKDERFGKILSTHRGICIGCACSLKAL
jgi:hypothetical protein